MRFTIFVTEEAAQFNLEPENGHEKKFLGLLKEYEGRVEIHQGVNICASHGGYLRDFGVDHTALAVTVHKEASKERAHD